MVSLSWVVLLLPTLVVANNTTTPATTTTALATVSPDVETLYKGRIPFIVQTYPVGPGGQYILDGWIRNFTAGKFSDVDYTTGCNARRANWPAQSHWLHLLPLAAAYTDVLPHTPNITQTDPYNFINNATVKTTLDTGIDWWFTNDFTEPACLQQGGLTNNTCPCGTPGLWNPNWFSNVILVPRQASQTCILLNSYITEAQRANCARVVQRGYSQFGIFIYGLGYLTGANTLDVSSNAINAGILQAYGGNSTGGEAWIDEAFGRVHDEVVIHSEVKADGIRGDGSFGQHLGILYNGNYGKDYTNLVLSLEIPAAGTRWAANATSRAAFEAHMDGSEWMIYRNTITKVLHWDISTIGRFLTFPVADNQATGSIKINMTQVLQLGQLWKSDKLQKVATDLLANGTSVNSGHLIGNRMFWDNDYMVHRGESYVTTVKMISSRTSNTECINMQNPFGFHQGQGNWFTYLKGNEYEDITAAWDWNLLPGITTDYAATPLICNFTQWSGNRTFVGGASDGNVGVAAMDYLNPYTGAFKYRKAWFFFSEDVQHVTVSDVKRSKKSGAGPVYSVLDQKRHGGDVYVDGKPVPAGGGNYTTPKTLWHNGIGYTFDSELELKQGRGGAFSSGIKQLSVDLRTRTGNWTLIGTSVQPLAVVDMFSAWIEHDEEHLSNPVSYSIYPGTLTNDAFNAKYTSHRIVTVRNDGYVSAAYDTAKGVAASVFWNRRGGAVTFPYDAGHGTRLTGSGLAVGTNKGVIVILDTNTWKLTVSDPTQKVKKVRIAVTLKGGAVAQKDQKCFGVKAGKKKTIKVELPKKGDVGKSVTVDLC